MKRLLIAVAIVLGILGSSAWSLWQFYHLKEEAAPLLAQMEQAAENSDLDSGVEAAERFLTLWSSREKKLIRFVRRDPLEHIGRCAVRLPQLGKQGDLADFAATASELRYSLDELWESELPLWDNLV